MVSLHGVPWTSQTCTAPWEWQLFIPQTLRPGGPQICHRVLTTFFEGWLKHSAGWRLNQHLLLSQTRRWERAQRTEVRSKRRLCANKKFKISGTDKILFAVDLNIYIFKPSSQVVAKECCEMHAEERVRDAAGRGFLHSESASAQQSVTATLPNPSPRKSWIADSLLINEGAIRVLYPRRQIAILSKMRTTINLSFKASWFGLQSSMPGNQRSLRSSHHSCF